MRYPPAIPQSPGRFPAYSGCQASCQLRDRMRALLMMPASYRSAECCPKARRAGVDILGQKARRNSAARSKSAKISFASGRRPVAVSASMYQNGTRGTPFRGSEIVLRDVAHHEAVAVEFAAHDSTVLRKPRVACREQSEIRHEQHARVEFVPAKRPRDASALIAPGAGKGSPSAIARPARASNGRGPEAAVLTAMRCNRSHATQHIVAECVWTLCRPRLLPESRVGFERELHRPARPAARADRTEQDRPS